MTIDTHFSEEQRLIQDSARQLFSRLSSREQVRKAEAGSEVFPREIWRQMAEMGWLGMTFPGAYGGLDCAFMDLYVLYLELGRHLVPSPHLETVGLCGALVAALGTEAQKTRLLPAVAEGRMVLTSALMEPEGLFGPESVALRATPQGQGWRLCGTKVMVAYAGAADLLVCAARVAGAPGTLEGLALFLVDPKAKGVSIVETPNMSGVPLYAVEFADVEATADDLLGEAGQVGRALQAAMMQAAVLQSAMVVGAGEAVLEMSVGYAKERVQFGVPIGKNQFVQHLVTDIAIQGHCARILALHAAWKISSGRPFLREAALAKAQASRAAAVMTFSAHEVHAGIGFMLDYDLQLFTRRAKYWEANLGDNRHHLELAMTETDRLARPLSMAASSGREPARA